MSDVTENITGRLLGEHHQAGQKVAIKVEPPLFKLTYADGDLDDLQKLLAFREQNADMSYLERSVQEKG